MGFHRLKGEGEVMTPKPQYYSFMHVPTNETRRYPFRGSFELYGHLTLKQRLERVNEWNRVSALAGGDWLYWIELADQVETKVKP